VHEVSPLTSPLHDRHVAAGAKLADFSGWSMPIEYAGGGVLAEHAAVRAGVGLFDVSHLGTATVRGPGAAAFVDSCLTNDLSRIGPGQAQYTLCCLPDGDPQAGGVVDDLIVYLHGPDDVLLVPNAANAAEVLARLSDAAPAGITVTDRHAEVAVLALQGPRSLQVLELLGLPGELPYMSFVTGTGGRAGAGVTVCRTGHTGEHGLGEGDLPDHDAVSGDDGGSRVLAAERRPIAYVLASAPRAPSARAERSAPGLITSALGLASSPNGPLTPASRLVGFSRIPSPPRAGSGPSCPSHTVPER